MQSVNDMSMVCHMSMVCDTVDGRNPAPPVMYETP